MMATRWQPFTLQFIITQAKSGRAIQSKRFTMQVSLLSRVIHSHGYLPGSWHEMGDGIQQDNSTAMRWYIAAARQGSLLASNRLALVYSFGQLGVVPDHELAQQYLELGQRGTTP